MDQKPISKQLNILFQLSGSISCYKSCFLISNLVRQGHRVQVVATPSALKFIGSPSLEGLTGSPVLSDFFKGSSVMEHIHLVRWADLFILCPASAHTLNALSCGLTTNFIGALFLAMDFKKPYMIFPAMNSRMFSHPVTQASISSLKSWGVQVFETEFGSLACGEEGWGRLLDLDIIEKKIQEQISAILKEKEHKKEKNKLKKKILKPLPHILVTAGGTQESIDSVRSFSNLSTGLTGSKIAEALILKGFQVTFLHSVLSCLPFSGFLEKDILNRKKVRFVSFRSFQDFKDQLQILLKGESFHSVIHSAALSDFSIQSIRQGKETFLPSKNWKCSSENGDLFIHLKKNEKLLYQIKSLSKNKSCYVFAFKLTYGETKDILARKTLPSFLQTMIHNKNLDFVIHNDLYEIEQEVQRRKKAKQKGDTNSHFHVFRFYKSSSKTPPSIFFSKEELADNLSSLLLELVEQKKEKKGKNRKDQNEDKSFLSLKKSKLRFSKGAL